MEKNKINKILQDLYDIDPSLRKNEKELIKIIEKLIISKPEVKIDQKFVKDLKERLLQTKNNKISFKVNYMNKFIYAGIGMAVMALILIPYYNNKNNTSLVPGIVKDRGVSIENLKEKAFGSLSDVSVGDDSSSESLNRAGGEATVMGLGAGNFSASSEDAVSSKMSILPMPRPVIYEYEYVGDDFSVDKDTSKVIKRIKSSNISAEEVVSLNSLDIGGLDYNNFDNLKLNNVSLFEDKESAYIISIDKGEQRVSIYKNWQSWPQEDGINDRLEISDVPSDQKIIDIANNFVNSYNLDLSPYGEPVVNKDWLKNYQRAENKNSVYIPQTMTVIYPLIINDKEVYNEYSNKYGLSVQVDIKNNKVSSVNEIVEHNYQSSDYEVVQDESRLIQIAERGGYRNYSYNRGDNNIEKSIVKLGTPSLEMVRVWRYNPQGSEELYVEAYVFPVVNSEESNFYRDYLIVPIIEDLVKEDEKQNSNISRPSIEPRVMDLSPRGDNQTEDGVGSVEILN